MKGERKDNIVGAVAYRERDGEEGEAEERKESQEISHLGVGFFLFSFYFEGFRLSSKVWREREALMKGEEREIEEMRGIEWSRF